MAKIYVANSWRNTRQQDVVSTLRATGHEVYDFKNPKEGDKGFHWNDLDVYWEDWTTKEYRNCLKHPIVEEEYKSNIDAMMWADVFVGVQPFGRSASLEMGWAAGMSKKTILLLDRDEPEMMVKMVDHICVSINEVIRLID
jgi:hypothetical protein